MKQDNVAWHTPPPELLAQTKLVLSWRSPSSRTGHNQCHAAGVLVRVRHCGSDTPQLGPLYENMTSYTKPEVHIATPSEED